MIRYIVGGILFISCSAITAAEVEKPEYNIPRITEAPVIDGDLSDAIWQQAKQVSLRYNTFPHDSTPAEVETTAYIAEDGEYLYVAFDARDPEPENIRAFYRQRDGMFQDDFVGILIDTFNEERRGYEFFVNALGSQGDLTVDETAGFNEDASWNIVWDSAGKITENGYQVEMAIPFRSIRYQSDLPEQIWGIDFLRIHPRDARNIYHDRPRDRDLNCELCQLAKIRGMPNLESKTTNMEFTPSLTYINSESRDVDPVTPWDTTTDELEVGLDMRWAITEDWILNTTLNPDFSQVEADGAQLDVNTTFALFFPERRPFFLEGADYFNSLNNYVYTRTIADPDVGTKLTGKSDGYTVGLIAAKDTTTNILLPSSTGSYIDSLDGIESNVFVGRVQKNIGERSNIGALVTSRSADDYSNTLASIDGTYYIDDNNLIRYSYAHTDTENPDAIRFDDGEEILAKDQTDSAMSLAYRHEKENYTFNATYLERGKDFRADAGFISQVDFKKAIVGGRYSWFGAEGSDWTRFTLSGDWDKTEDQSGQLLEEELEAYFNVLGPYQLSIQTGLLSRDRFYDGEIFKEKWWMNFVRIFPTKNIRITNFLRKGDMIDFSNSQLGKGFDWETRFTLTVGQHFSTELFRRHVSIDVTGGELFTAEQYDLRFAYQFDLKNRLSLIVQHTDIDRNASLYDVNNDADPDNDIDSQFRDLSTQLIYSYQLNAITRLFVGYSDAGFQNDNINRIEKTDRTLFAKFSYNYQL